MLDIVHFAHNSQKGPHLTVFGAVHGREKCGTVAINHWIERFKTGQVVLKQGTVTFVPICNPKAYEQNKRFVEVNLNRIYVKKDQPEKYEEKVVQELIPLIEACDVFLDLHSVNSPSQPFIFQDADGTAYEDFADCLGVSNIIVGWNDYFPSGAFCSGMAHAIHQGKVGAVVECGQHDDPQSIEVAKTVIGNALAHLDIIEATLKKTETPSRYTLFAHDIRREGAVFAKAWKGFDVIQAGEAVANDFTVSKECRIVMPDPNAPTGEEWFYLVEKKV